MIIQYKVYQLTNQYNAYKLIKYSAAEEAKTAGEAHAMW